MEMEKANRPKILVIDDNDQIRLLLRSILNERYDCSEVCSAEAALLVLAEESFDLVITDKNLGGMSGLELIPHIHSISADIIVLMISGQVNTEGAIETLRAGVFDYIMKPFDLRHVEETVERALRQSSLLKEKRRYKDPLGGS